MSFNGLNQTPPVTPEDVQARILQAKQEAEAKKSVPVAESTPIVETSKEAISEGEKGGIDDLLSDIKAEKDAVPEKPTSVEEEVKLKEAFEKIKPGVEKLAGILIGEKNLNEGKMDYSVLTNNTGAYIEARKNDIKIDIDANEVFKSIEPELNRNNNGSLVYFDLLKQNTNRTVFEKIRDYQNPNYRPSGLEASLDFWEKGRSGVSPISAAQNEMSDAINNFQEPYNVRRVGTFLDKGVKRKINNPEDYVEGMWRYYRRSVDLSRDQESIDRNKDNRPDSRAQGFAFAALEAGDVDVAAKALAFANSIKPLDATAVAQIKERLAKLKPSVRKQFATVFDQERNRKREYAFVNVEGKKTDKKDEMTSYEVVKD